MLKQLRLRGASQIDGEHVGPLCEDVQYQAESPGAALLYWLDVNDPYVGHVAQLVTQRAAYA